jgi:cell wall-associated NlpC family hydrolase
MVSLWLHEVGYDGPWPTSKASVASWEELAAARGLYVSASSVHAGDLVTFQFDSDPEGDHMGLVTGAVHNGTVPTIEGNTSPGDAGSQANGGGVFQRQRPLSVVHHFIRLAK